jgi:hypothetical protein
VLSNIAPPKLRREAALFQELKNSWINGKSLLFEQLQDVPVLRLRSRNSIWIDDPGFTNTVYDFLERWREIVVPELSCAICHVNSMQIAQDNSGTTKCANVVAVGSSSR